MKKVIIFIILLIISTYAHTTTINIPTDYSTIQAGIDAAVDYDTVLVDTGTYVENINFNGKNITVASLFLTTQNTSYISQTVIDGDSSGSVVTFDTGEDTTAMLTGFIIKNGYAANYGGGICCKNSSPNIKSVYVSNNYAYKGGGIFCKNSNPNFINMQIINNSTPLDFGDGGGILCVDYSCPYLKNVTISGNYATMGGGVYCYNNSNPIMSKVIIIDNYAIMGGLYEPARGGGICSGESNLNLNNVSIINNSAIGSVSTGGGIYCFDSNHSLINVTISNNFANIGGGIYCANNSKTSLVNCILWNDSPQEIFFCGHTSPDTITILYSDIEEGEAGIITCDNGTVNWEEGNIDLNPLFVDPANGNYHLSWANYPNPDSTMSPCIDAGDPDSPLDPDGTITDMGAYYYNQNQAVDDEPENITQNSFISYPNPITANTNDISISFSINKLSKINISLYNIKGQLVTEIFNDNKPSGTHTITSNINNLCSGIYFIKMNVDGKNRAVKKMVKIE